jgi:hypothetical protein
MTPQCRIGDVTLGVALLSFLLSLGGCADDRLTCADAAVYVRYDGTVEGCIPSAGVERYVTEGCSPGAGLEATLDPSAGRRFRYASVVGSDLLRGGCNETFYVSIGESRQHRSVELCEFCVTSMGARTGDVTEGELTKPCVVRNLDPPGSTETLVVEEFVFRAPLLDYVDLPPECAYLRDE